MKKTFKLLSLALVAGSLAFVASCIKDEDPAEPIDYSAPEKQATIRGTLLTYDDNGVQNAQYVAASSVTIIASVSYSSLSGNSNNNGAYTTSVITNNNGEFTVNVPATEDGVPVDFVVNDKKGTQWQITYDANNDPVKTSVSGVWRFRINYNYLVYSGQEIIIPQSSIFVDFSEDVKAGDPR
jgi:hypothetical protein